MLHGRRGAPGAGRGVESSRSPDPQRSAEPVPTAAHVEARELRLRRGSRTVFDGVSCSFPRDHISVVLGGSGSGKTTLLRMIGCLLRPDSGEIWVDGELELTRLDEHDARQFRRRVGMMFQHGALLDSMTIFDNVALPLREHTPMRRAEIEREVHECFGSVGLRDVGELFPAQLSGGMIKRAALARALVLAPDILLCDEPFSGLDPATVQLVEDLLVDVNRRLGVTMIIASHHIASTFRMANGIVLLTDGKALCGTPETFRKHEDPRVEEFFAGEPR